MSFSLSLFDVFDPVVDAGCFVPGFDRRLIKKLLLVDKFPETLRSLLALDDVFEERFLVVEVALVELLLDAGEDVLGCPMVGAIGVDDGSWGRLLFQERLLAQVAI